MPILPSHRKYLHGHFHSFLNPSIKHHQRLSTLLSPNSTANVAGRTLGYRKMPPTSGGYILAKRSSHMISFVDSMLNILARMIFQLIPVACPNHFASGDVYTLLDILRSAPVDADLILVNQDLAGFFTSIDQERFIGSWFMLLNFLRRC